MENVGLDRRVNADNAVQTLQGEVRARGISVSDPNDGAQGGAAPRQTVKGVVASTLQRIVVLRALVAVGHLILLHVVRREAHRPGCIGP